MPHSQRKWDSTGQVCSVWYVECFMKNQQSGRKMVNTANVLPLCFIPGPHEPRDLAPFLEPFIEDMELFSEGKECRLWDGRQEKFSVHTLYLIVDLPAATKLCKDNGCNGYSPCRLCKVQGIADTLRNHHMYSPSYKVLENGIEEERINISELPSRNIEGNQSRFATDWRLEQEHWERFEGAACRFAQAERLNGSSDLSTMLLHLLTYRSSPIDIMHLLLLNVSETPWSCYSLNGFSSPQTKHG